MRQQGAAKATPPKRRERLPQAPCWPSMQATHPQRHTGGHYRAAKSNPVVGDQWNKTVIELCQITAAGAHEGAVLRHKHHAYANARDGRATHDQTQRNPRHAYLGVTQRHGCA